MKKTARVVRVKRAARATDAASALGKVSSGHLTPKHLTKREFSVRLYNLMHDRGWKQSELARQADMSRNNISTYMREQSFPTRENLEKLAKVFKMKPEELLPNSSESTFHVDNPSLEMRVITGQLGKAWLRVDRMVTMATATKIIELLNDDKVLAGN